MFHEDKLYTAVSIPLRNRILIHFVLSALILGLSGSLGFAQTHPSDPGETGAPASRQTQYGNQQWFHYYNQTHFKERWVWLSDGGFRTADACTEKAQYIARTGIGFKVRPQLRVAVGFTHSGVFRDSGIRSLEFRPYQEVLLKQEIGKVKVSHRMRVEERIFRTIEAGEIQPNHRFSLRLRYQAMIKIPVWQQDNRVRELGVNIGDEFFVNADPNAVYTIFDQNRILAGPYFRINDHWTTNLTYSHQFASQNAPGQYAQTYIIWIGLRHRLEL